MGFFGGVNAGLNQARDYRQRQNETTLDALVKRAQLAEAGYDIQPSNAGLFGSAPNLVQNPNFQGTKVLERKKLETENSIADMKLKAMQNAQSGGQSSSQSDFVMSPDGRFVSNPNKVKPLNELQQGQLRSIQEKEQAAGQLKSDQEENLRNSAQDTIDTIETVKKGSKYFGPMGNVPSELAPSSLAGEYGERKNWEANVNKLLSGKVLEVMAALKKTSKNGSTGFGALSEKELALLQNASTALNRGLNPEDAVKYLDEMERIHKKVLGGGHGMQPVQDSDPLEAEAQQAIANGADPAAVKARMDQMRARRG